MKKDNTFIMLALLGTGAMIYLYNKKAKEAIAKLDEAKVQ